MSKLTDKNYDARSDVSTRPEAAIVGVDIGGTKIAVGLVVQGMVRTWAEVPTPIHDPEAAVHAIAGLLARCRAAVGLEPVAIGVGCTGPIDPLTGTLGHVDLLPGWTGYPLAARLTDALGVPCVAENDADAAALGEWLYGAGQGASRFIHVSVGTGIGGGIVIDGALYRGAGGTHPEFGHQTIDPSGPLCYCGAKGCWEVLASGTALTAAARARGGGWADATAHLVFARAELGDPIALTLLSDQQRWLAIGLANLVTSFAPDIIVFGGGLMARFDTLMPAVVEQAAALCGLVPLRPGSVRAAALGSHAPLVGAAEAWLQRNRKDAGRGHH